MTSHASEIEALDPGGVSVLLDLGDGVGALLVQAPEEVARHEIEICNQLTGYRTHAIVRKRESGGPVRFIAVFPEVTPGVYEVLGTNDSVLTTVHVEEGRVTNANVVDLWHQLMVE